MIGTLYVIATPIGNLSDITLRAIETLKKCDVIACEDTRRTEILMQHLSLRKPLQRYDEHSHDKSSRQILKMLAEGRTVGLVTDAGTPAVSDPGRRLVAEVVQAGCPVVPIPGPSALTALLSAAGLPGEGFTFLGFLPRREGRARRALQEALGLGRNVVIFESPFRVVSTMDMVAGMSPEAPVVIGRELTKIHEEFVRGTAVAVLEKMKAREVKGEVVILIGVLS